MNFLNTQNVRLQNLESPSCTVIRLEDLTVFVTSFLNFLSFFSYSQAESIKASLEREDVAVATMTSSGKSLCYNVPVLEELFNNSSTCALYMFPTKVIPHSFGLRYFRLVAFRYKYFTE